MGKPELTLNGHRTILMYGTFHRMAIPTTYAPIMPNVTFCVSVTVRPSRRDSLTASLATTGAAASDARFANPCSTLAARGAAGWKVMMDVGAILVAWHVVALSTCLDGSHVTQRVDAAA